MSSFFVELSLVMLITIVVSFLFHKLKQPLIVGYIFSGILAGPLFFDILSSADGYQAFSHIGIALLLFIVGLHLNLKLIKEIGSIAFLSGMGQIAFTAIFGFLLAYFFNFGVVPSILIGIALTFSSTIIVVKLLSDKQEMDRVHGKIAMGILIIQDLFAALMLIVLASFSGASEVSLVSSLIKTFISGIVAVIGVFVVSKFFIEKLLDKIASSQEFLFIFVLAWCLGVASVFGYFGFSLEVGALLAGVALASSPYQYELSSRIKPLRDFFLVMFFILLGSQMIPVDQVPNVIQYNQGDSLIMIGKIFSHNIVAKAIYVKDIFSNIFVPALALSFFVILIKPIIVFFVLNFLGFHSKAGIMSGLSLAQISEFSLIMILLAKSAELVTQDVVSMLTLVIIITILVSTYFIEHLQGIFKKTHKFLKHLEIRKPLKGTEKNIRDDLDVIIFGYDRIGFSLLKTIEKQDEKYTVIDEDPEVIKKLDSKGIPCVYGDASDNDFVEEFHLEGVKLLISTIPDLDVSISLIRQFKKRNKSAVVILTTDQIDNALDLYREGADYVILPHFLGGNYISNLLEKYNQDLSEFINEKITHISELKERKELGFEHPRKE